MHNTNLKNQQDIHNFLESESSNNYVSVGLAASFIWHFTIHDIVWVQFSIEVKH